MILSKVLKETNVFVTLLVTILFATQITFQPVFTKNCSLKKIKIPLEKFFVLDSIGYVCGLRKVVSDIAWIQLLQYYGTQYYELQDEVEKEEKNFEVKKYLMTEEKIFSHEEHHHGGHSYIQPGKYKKLLKYCQRIIRLDPNFSYVYFYGSSVLTWNLERPDEALELISEGIKNLDYQKNNPDSDYWTLILYQSAIVYKKGEKYRELLSEIEKIVSRGKAPNLVKSILANLYKKFALYDEAIKVWKEILATNDPEYIFRAQQQIQEITKLKFKR
jgi:tetratricopeptide (TPR) repeat protein